MTWRDIVQQRMTLPNGDTAWRPSPLVSAAMTGSLAVLDGVHRINPGTFSVLHRSVGFPHIFWCSQHAKLWYKLAILGCVTFHHDLTGMRMFYFRLIHDRELTLFDGTRLMGKERYDKIKDTQELTDEEMHSKYVNYCDFAQLWCIPCTCNTNYIQTTFWNVNATLPVISHTCIIYSVL